MSADPNEPTLEDGGDIFSGLKKKKKGTSSKKRVEFDAETAEAPAEGGDAAAEPAGDAPAEDDAENMFADLKKKSVH